MTVTFPLPGLSTSVLVLAGGLLGSAVTVMVTLAPAFSEPAAGLTVSPRGWVIENDATGPPTAVRVKVPLNGPPVGGCTRVMVVGEAARVPGGVTDGDGDGVFVRVGRGVGVGVRDRVAVGVGVGDPGLGGGGS